MILAQTTSGIKMIHPNGRRKSFLCETGDLRQNLYSYEHPLAQKTINGIDLRIATGFMGYSKSDYLLYVNGKRVRKTFFSVDEVKDYVKANIK